MMEGALLDKAGRRLASTRVWPSEDDLFEGVLLEVTTDDALRALFLSYESAVLGQMLSVVDQIEQEIDGLSPVFHAENGATYDICDVQIYPTGRLVSFRVRR